MSSTASTNAVPTGPETSPARQAIRDPKWLSLAFAFLIVIAAVAVARPGGGGNDDGELGPVAQVAPADDDAAERDTAPAIDKLAPNFRLETLDGEEVRLSDLRGTPIFLNFWATWCVFCVSEMPAMQELADRHGDDVIVLGVNVGEDPAPAQRFADEAEIRYPLALDRERSVTETYEVRAMPTSLFIDEHGVVRSVGFGPLTPPEMEEHLAPLLAETA